MTAEDKIDLRFLYALEKAGNARIIKWCMEMELLPSSLMCPECKIPMKLAKVVHSSDGFAWSCKHYSPYRRVVRSIRNGSFFLKRLSIVDVLLLTYFWSCKLPNALISGELFMNVCTITDQKAFCRDVCIKMCEYESETVGGKSRIVEVDAFKYKSNVKYKLPLIPDKQWIVVGYERGSNKSFLSVIDKNSKNAIINVMTKYILSNSKVACHCLKFGSSHLKYYSKKCEVEVIDPDTVVEDYNSFHYIKKATGFTVANDYFSSYIAEEMWRLRHKHCGNIFKCMLDALSFLSKKILQMGNKEYFGDHYLKSESNKNTSDLSNILLEENSVEKLGKHISDNFQGSNNDFSIGDNLLVFTQETNNDLDTGCITCSLESNDKIPKVSKEHPEVISNKCDLFEGEMNEKLVQPEIQNEVSGKDDLLPKIGRKNESFQKDEAEKNTLEGGNEECFAEHNV